MADLSELRSRLVEGARNIMFAAANDAVLQLQFAAPQRSGDLARSEYSNQVSDAPRISWAIGFTAPQGEWTEYGVAPHTLGEIGTLRHWVDQEVGDIFRRYTGWEVSMPARPWFFPTLQAIWPGVVAANVDAAGWG